MEALLFLLGALVVGFSKAVCDTVTDHYEQSIFSDWNWFRRNGKGFSFDGWHVFDIVRDLGAVLSIIATLLKNELPTDWSLAIVWFIIARFVFMVFYKKLFKEKK